MARYQPPGGRGTQPRGLLPTQPPPAPALRRRAVVAVAMGVLSLFGLALGLGNLRRGVFVAAVTLVFAAAAIWLGAGASRRAPRGGTGPPRAAARVGHRDRARRVRPGGQRGVAAGPGGVLAAAERVRQLHE